MTYARHDLVDDSETLHRMPSWVTSFRPETPEDVAFLSGAALNHLHLVLSRDEVPQTLVRARLALRAAEACVTHQGRPERLQSYAMRWHSCSLVTVRDQQVRSISLGNARWSDRFRLRRCIAHCRPWIRTKSQPGWIRGRGRRLQVPRTCCRRFSRIDHVIPQRR